MANADSLSHFALFVFSGLREGKGKKLCKYYVN